MFDKLLNPESRYTVPQLLRWLWRVLKGNRRQTVLNAAIGVVGVGVSLLMVFTS
jgi:hypothetical protein